MSSEEEGKRHKRRRLQNACDICRRKKVKCDSATMPDNICTNCISFKVECTHTLPVRKRGPKTDYVEQLESRVKKLEEALLAYDPDVDLDELMNSPKPNSSSFTKPSSTSKEPQNPSSASSSLSPVSSTPELLPNDPLHKERFLAMDAEFGKMSVGNAMKGRFFGPSSTFKYFTDAIKIKKGYIKAEHPGLSDLQTLKRTEYWKSPPYELATAEKQTVQSYDFPPEDLMHDLIDIHFQTSHCTMPVLYEPKFRKDVQDGLHYKDPFFGGVVMMMCAVSSRYSDDPRVVVPGEKLYSAGWKYYEQVQIMRKSMFEPPSLHELQMYCLALKYTLGTSTPQSTWILVSLGIRFCQELGIHRRRPPGFKITIEEEERKRVFWHLVGLDRFVSSFVGRPSGYRDEDFDADLPAECDDQYIVENEDGSLLFMQPIDKPSVMMYMTCMSRLQDILSVALRALYSTTKSRVQMGLTGDRWEQEVVSELDSALNRWLDSIPEHLRWNVGQRDRMFFIQSVSLYVTYNIVQIQIHRPLVASSNRHESTSSSIICANAARSIAGIISTQMERPDIPIDSQNLIGCFMCTVTLLMHMWSSKQQGIVSYLQRDTGDVEKCKAYLKLAEKRWFTAGRFGDLINELSFVKDIPIPQTVRASTKRARHESVDMTHVPQQILPPPPLSAAPSSDSNYSSADSSANVWATNYIPQYGGRQDFPSIQMQMPVNSGNPGMPAYTADAINIYAPPIQPVVAPPMQEFTSMSGYDASHLFWQAPMGFDMSEWDHYIARTTDELQRNQHTGTL